MDRALKNAVAYALQICATLEDPVKQLWDYRSVVDYSPEESAALAEVLHRHGYIEPIPYTLKGSRQARFKPRILNLMYNAQTRARRREQYRQEPPSGPAAPRGARRRNRCDGR
jgi:hypothetical protein